MDGDKEKFNLYTINSTIDFDTARNFCVWFRDEDNTICLRVDYKTYPAGQNVGNFVTLTFVKCSR